MFPRDPPVRRRRAKLSGLVRQPGVPSADREGADPGGSLETAAFGEQQSFVDPAAVPRHQLDTHAVAQPPVVHAVPPGAENTLGCAVYGIVLQPDPTLQQQQQQQQQHPVQAQQPSLQVGGDGGHKCGACGHDISHLANPHEHQCMVSQDRSFQCTQCLKIFQQATDLLEHQCVQVEQKPFVCGVCKMGFSLLTSLAQHHTAHSGSNPVNRQGRRQQQQRVVQW
ncbi:hypothetical protein GN956_G22824 [Arapaima gigas]